MPERLVAALPGLFGVVGAVLVSIGLCGLLAFWSQRLAAGWVDNLPIDGALSIGWAAIPLVAVALLSAYIPARRAARIDPVEALRHD